MQASDHRGRCDACRCGPETAVIRADIVNWEPFSFAAQFAYSTGIETSAKQSNSGTDAWVNAHAVVMLVATGATLLSYTAAPIAIGAIVSFGYLVISRKWLQWQQKTMGRYAHQLTLIRLLLLCYAAARLPDIEAMTLLLLFAGNVILDVVDGYIARKLDQATHFGMVFDREVDGVYVLIASLYFYLVAGIPAWILVPGLLPYGYRLIAWALGNPSISGKKRPRAAFLAGVNFVLILVAVWLTGDARFIVLVISTAIVTISFLVSFWELARFRNESPVLEPGPD